MSARIPAMIAATGLVLSLVACSSETPPDASAGSWTVLTYSLADTNLEEFMMTDLEEIGAVGSQDGLNLVALVDRAADYTDTPVLGLDDWVGGREAARDRPGRGDGARGPR